MIYYEINQLTSPTNRSAFLAQKGFQDLDRLANLSYFLQAALAHPLPGLNSSSSAQAVATRPRRFLSLASVSQEAVPVGLDILLESVPLQ